MIQQSTLQFLKNLKKNNRKEWFDANRTRYEDAKKDFENLGEALIKKLCSIDETVAHLRPKDCMFRINRDVRFSKDKSPYKTNLGIYISKGGKKGVQAGYYFHLEPGGSFVAGGLWMPLAPELKKVRQEIDYNWDEFRKIVHNKKFRNVYSDLDRSPEYALSRPPKGYEEENPAIEFLKLKSLIVSAKIDDSELSSPRLVNKITSYFETMKPMIDFINRAIEE